MTQEEAINARELLLVEQRKIRQAVRILKSESIIPCAGVSMAIGQYNRRLQQIDDDIREIAEQYSLSLQEEGNACAVEFQMAEEANAAGSTSTKRMPGNHARNFARFPSLKSLTRTTTS